MKITAWLACFTVSIGCGFGDNARLSVQPDSGVDPIKPDASVIQPTQDASVDAPPATSCTLVPQSGCSGQTPACDLAADGTTFCRAVTSQGTSNNHCVLDSECRDGYTCTDDGDGNAAWCARFCTQDSGCTGTGSRCVVALSAAATALGVSVCSNACDPYAQTGCPTGMGCLPFDAAAGDFTDCAYMGTKLDGQTCATDEECRDGSVCVTSNTVTACRSLCIVGNASSCVTGSCVGFTQPHTIGATTYGACL